MNGPDPLTPEERDLARLLGRATPSAPSAALDDAVLAAARAAVQGPTPVQDTAASAAVVADARPRARRPRSRLPAMLGVAASVVFAVGIAWQLKPDAPQIPSAAEQALPAAAVPDAPAAAAEAAPTATAEGAASAKDRAPAQPWAAPPPPSPMAAPTPPALQPPKPAPVAAPVRPAAPAPAAAPPAPQAAQAYAMDSVAAPAAAPEPVTTTGASLQESARAKSSNSMAAPVAGELMRSSGAPGVMRRAQRSAAEEVSAVAADAVSADTLSAEVEADAALPRKQWIKRIRERRDAGDRDTARASLERYLQQYPEVRIPHDLRQLLDN